MTCFLVTRCRQQYRLWSTRFWRNSDVETTSHSLSLRIATWTMPRELFITRAGGCFATKLRFALALERYRHSDKYNFMYGSGEVLSASFRRYTLLLSAYRFTSHVPPTSKTRGQCFSFGLPIYRRRGPRWTMIDTMAWLQYVKSSLNFMPLQDGLRSLFYFHSFCFTTALSPGSSQRKTAYR